MKTTTRQAGKTGHYSLLAVLTTPALALAQTPEQLREAPRSGGLWWVWLLIFAAVIAAVVWAAKSRDRVRI